MDTIQENKPLQPCNLSENATAQNQSEKSGNKEKLVDGAQVDSTLLSWQTGKHQLPKPKDLPPVFRELVTNAPKSLQTLVFVSATPAIGTYATRLRLNYVYDQSPSACLLQVIVCGDQSSGKSFARYVQQVIMQRLLDRDIMQRREEQKYNELKRRQGKKDGKLPPEPKTDIVNLPPSVSITMLMKRADASVVKYGVPKTLFMFADELSTITQSNKRAFADLKQIMKTAYDLGSFYGQDYLSENSYSTVVDVMLNSLFCGTPAAIDRYMDKAAIEGGNITRTILCPLDSHIGDEPPTMKPLSQEQQQAIKEMIDKLMEATYLDDKTMQPEYLIDTRWLDKEVQKWCAERRDEATKSCSKAIDVFYKRSSVSAFRIAALCQYLYQLEGKRTAKEIQRLVKQIYLSMADYILRGMTDKWGTAYEEIDAGLQPSTYRPSQLYDNLPTTFTRDLLKVALERLGQTSPVKNVVSRWLKKGWIKKMTKDQFQKLKDIKP